MKIALLSWESLHSIAVGGVAAHVTELAAAMGRAGHELHVFTRMAAGQAAYEYIDFVHYHRCPFDLNPNFVDEVNNMCGSFARHILETEEFSGPFDIIHAHDWLAANAMIWICQQRRRRGVLTIHSTEYGRCSNSFAGGLSLRIRHQESAGTYWAERVITVSQSLKRELGLMYEVPDSKVSVIYNGVNAHNYDGFIEPARVKCKYSIAPMDPTVLFAGRMAHQKGPDLLVDAIPALLSTHPSAKFIFAGDGEMRRTVEARADDLGVTHCTRFLGFQMNGSLADLYKACDVVCVPSRNEPFGIVILEAWSAGKPVVSTRNGGPEEFVWHGVNGLKVYANPQSIAWGLGTIFGDFDRARWMGRNGRIAAEAAFTWDAVAEQTLNVYRS